MQSLSFQSLSFQTLALRPELQVSIAALAYETMTPVQQQSLPPMLELHDVIAQASTGSGKTAAFAISLLNRLDASLYSTQALVLCPTRELAEQVSAEIRRLASTIQNIKLLTLCGGKPMGGQLASLQRDPHIVVGTPGRILKHLEKETLHLDSVQTLVLDEADRMLDMGFHDDIMQIIARTPTTRQSLLFSATYPVGIQDISNKVQRSPIAIQVKSQNDTPAIEQIFYEINNREREEVLYRVIAHYQPESTLVFCNTRQQCEELAKSLREHDLHARALHGDMEQFERDEVLTQFAGKSCSVLIATDVAARGLDVKELAAVINFELSRDPEVHIHRIGRTARAGKKGLAISLFATAERRQLQAIETYQGAHQGTYQGTYKNEPAVIAATDNLEVPANLKLFPPMVTLCVNGGRKEKVRAGDLLGALTAGGAIRGDQIGKITLFDKLSYVAVEQQVAKLALSILEEGKIKGRKFRVRRLR